jgi:salicylate hydroxylase
MGDFSSEFHAPSAQHGSLHILIIGAGICGLACAAALRPYHRVTILERSKLNDEIGAAILSNPPCTRILEGWGFDFEKIGSPPNKQVTEYTSQGAVRLQFNPHAKEAFGAEWYMNHRVDLHRGQLPAFTAVFPANIPLCRTEITGD